MRGQRKKQSATLPSDVAGSNVKQDDSGVPLVPFGSSGQLMRDVVANGDRDLVLQIQEPGTAVELYYMVSSAVLRQASSYFRVLLDPSKFNEGVHFDLELRALIEKHGKLQSILPEDLPR